MEKVWKFATLVSGKKKALDFKKKIKQFAKLFLKKIKQFAKNERHHATGF
jgi:hypothetical protein